MARPVWKGAITFGLVTIPVGVYSAIERKSELSFRLLHDKDKSSIDYRRFCEAEDVEVPWSHIVRGYEYEKGQFVVMTDEDFAKARVPGTDTFEIRDFVRARDIDALFFEQPYYVAPAGKAGVKAYALLRDALKQTERVGVGTVVMRQRQHLGGLHPRGDALVLSVLRYPHELRDANQLDLPREGEGYAKREMALGLQLVESLAGQWDPTQYRDTYRDVLMDLIEKKVAGKQIEVPEERKRPARVVNLIKALEESFRAPVRHAGAKAPSRRRAAAARPARRKRAA